MAWTDPISMPVGHAVTSAEFATYVLDNLTALRRQTKIKTADESVTSSTALQSDDHLTITLGASESWIIEMVLYYTGDATTGDLKLALNYSGSTSVSVWGVIGPVSSISISASSSSAEFRANTAIGDGTTVALGCSSTSVALTARLQATLTTTSGGTFTLRWAQNGSTGTATTLLAGSSLIATRVSS